MKVYYVLTLDIGRLETIIGYSTNRYLIDLATKLDTFNNIKLYTIECEVDELSELLYDEFGCEFNRDDDLLKLHQSRDNTKFIIGSTRTIETLLYETSCKDQAIVRATSAIMILYKLRPYFKEDELFKILTLLLGYLIPLTQNQDYVIDIDTVKLLARKGYLGTITGGN